MTAIRVHAGRGWGWIVEGWGLFAKAPGIWVVMILINLVISMVLSFIPFVGVFAQALLAPVLAGGMLYGAALLAQGERLRIGHLFQGFQDQGRMGPLMILGLVSVTAYVLMALVVFMFIGGGMMMGAAMDNTGAMVPPEAMGGLFVGAGLIALLIMLAIALVLGMVLFYGVSLVMLAGQDAWPAIQASVAASWINILPLTVFGLVYFVLMIVAAIPFGLGFLVLMPVTLCATYASYREVFEERPVSGIRLEK